MPCKPGVAGSIPGFSIKKPIKKTHIKPLSVSLRVLPSYNKHTNHKPSRRYWFLPRESHKKFFFFTMLVNITLGKGMQGIRIRTPFQPMATLSLSGLFPLFFCGRMLVEHCWKLRYGSVMFTGRTR